MKTGLRSFATAFVVSLTLSLTTLPGRAQNVTVTAAEFQRLVYSGHVLTHLSEKPELYACLHPVQRLP
jgi:hypothetical protein